MATIYRTSPNVTRKQSQTVQLQKPRIDTLLKNVGIKDDTRKPNARKKRNHDYIHTEYGECLLSQNRPNIHFESVLSVSK